MFLPSFSKTNATRDTFSRTHLSRVMMGGLLVVVSGPQAVWLVCAALALIWLAVALSMTMPAARAAQASA